MICYKDKTFCVSKCVNKDCQIRLTDKIKEDARDFGLPITMSDFRCQNLIKLAYKIFYKPTVRTC